jgi:hypothetical protein
MTDNDKLISTRTNLIGAEDALELAGAEDLFITELDDRLELSILLIASPDLNPANCKPNNNCNTVAGCT